MRYSSRNRQPLVLVSPDIQSRGKEFADMSISLSSMYTVAVEMTGGIAITVPPTISKGVIAECVRRSDGVLLTGGDDVAPQLYESDSARRALRTVQVTPDGGRRDLRELLLIEQVFSQRKPLLAICRGHQVLNVALGGTLLADLPTERPRSLKHRRMDRRCAVVHEARLTADSLLARITGKQKLGVNSTHHQAVARVAPGLRATALSPDKVVEALELQAGTRLSPFLLSVQFHPERLVNRHPEHAAIFKAFVQACAQSSNKYEG